MSVTYLNRLVVLGSPARVAEFRDTMRRTLNRKVGDQRWKEVVPFHLKRRLDDEFYHDDDVVELAEGRMFDAVMNHWDETSPSPRRSWWNQPAIRSLDDERTFAMAEIAEALMKEKAAKKKTLRRPSK